MASREDTFEVFQGRTHVHSYDPTTHPTTDLIIADMAGWIEAVELVMPGDLFTIRRGGREVALGRMDDAGMLHAVDIPEDPPGFDPTWQMPGRVMAQLKLFFPGALNPQV